MRIILSIATLSVLLSLIFVMTGSRAAERPAGQDPSANAQTTAEMRDCSGKAYQQADAELNKVYQQLMAKLTDPSHKQALVVAERAWLQFRDDDCKFQSYINRGGTIYPVVYNGCLSEITVARTKLLRRILAENP